MKKLISLLLALLLVLSLAACGGSSAPTPTPEPTPVPTPVPTPKPKVPTDAEQGAILCCKYIKRNLKDPDSFQIRSIKAVQGDEKGTHWEYKIEYSAKNSFGGNVVDTMYMKSDKNSCYTGEYIEEYAKDLDDNGYPTPSIDIKVVRDALK